MDIIIPMAGKSERFFKAEFNRPKFLLPLGHKMMIERVVETFDPGKDFFHFIVNREDHRVYRLDNLLKKITARSKVYSIPRHDQGPLGSLLAIKNEIPPDREIIVNYCDFLVQWNYGRFLKQVRSQHLDGALTSFKGFHPASMGNVYYAYIRTEKNGTFKELREKQPFTANRSEEHASTGTYYFKNWGVLVNFAGKVIEQKPAINEEYYPSLVYNLMQKAGLKSKVFEVEKFICLGTPADYQQYCYWQNLFKKVNFT